MPRRRNSPVDQVTDAVDADVQDVSTADADSALTDLPPWWHHPIAWAHNVAVAAAVLTQFGPWLWTGELLLTWAPVILFAVLGCWLVFRRHVARGAWSVLAILMLAWPWLWTAWQARAEPLSAADENWERGSCLTVAMAGDEQVFAELGSRDLALVAARLPIDDETARKALRRLPGLDEHKEFLPRLLPTRTTEGSETDAEAEARKRPAYRYVITSRWPMESWRSELLPESGGAFYRSRLRIAEQEVHLVVAALPSAENPIAFRYQHAALRSLCMRLAELDGPVILLLPQGMPWGSWRWQSLHAVGMRLPAGPPPSRSWLLRDGQVYLLVRGLAAQVGSTDRLSGGRDQQAADIAVPLLTDTPR